MRSKRIGLVLLVLSIAAGGAALLRRRVDGLAGRDDLVAEQARAFAAVERDPGSAAAWARLGDAQAAADDPVAAEESYRTALRLGAPGGEVHARLGFLLYAHGADEDALYHLEQAEWRGASMPLLDETLTRLRRESKAKAENPKHRRTLERVERVSDRASGASKERPDAGSGAADSGAGDGAVLGDRVTCSIPVESSARRVVISVLVGEPGALTRARLIYDTGASLTALSKELIERAGLGIDEGRAVRAITAVGEAELETAIVPRVEVGGRAFEDVRVAVCPGCGGAEADGLFGLDLQAALGLTLDLAAGVARVSGCEE